MQIVHHRNHYSALPGQQVDILLWVDYTTEKYIMTTGNGRRFRTNDADAPEHVSAST